jgi:hypothetical protein
VDEIDRICSTVGEEINTYVMGKVKGRDHWDDLVESGRIILNLILNTMGMYGLDSSGSGH